MAGNVERPEEAVDPQALGKIIKTDATCIIAERSYPGIPTLVWPERIDVPVSDWLRALVVDENVTPKSAEEYAKVLRLFRRFCRERQREWDTVDDALLKIWRERMRKQVEPERVNYCLTTVFRFYLWAEREGRLKHHVGAYDRTDLPDYQWDMDFPISAKKVVSQRKNGARSVTWVTPLTVSVPETSAGKRHTPTEQEIQRLHTLAMEGDNGIRNSLILLWAEECGPRVSEILQIRKSDLPTPDQLAELIDEDEFWRISVARKGHGDTPPASGFGDLVVSTELVIRTLEFIDLERRAIVEKFRGAVGYVEPDEVFLSTTTGEVLQPDSVTALAGKLFRRANIKKANIHRLRARFAVRTIEGLLDALDADGLHIAPGISWMETILTHASERMAHMSPQSLRPYLSYVLHRRIRTSNANKASALEARVRLLELREADVLKRLSALQELQGIGQLMSIERWNQAAGAMRTLADSIEVT